MRSTLKGIITLSLLLTNSLFWFTLLLILGVLKATIPCLWLQVKLAKVFSQIAYLWMQVNLFPLTRAIKQWNIQYPTHLKKEGQYIVIANHQSYIDVFILFLLFEHRIPAPRFFVKPPRKWNTFFTYTYRMLDFPIVQSHSKVALAQNPQLRTHDVAVTKATCENLKHLPFTMVNFVEGTRFTPKRHQVSHSPFVHLLSPKSGGLQIVLEELGNQLDGILDVTICYQAKTIHLWNFLCGRIQMIHAEMQYLPLEAFTRLDSSKNEDWTHIKVNLHTLWRRKDQRMRELQSSE